MLAWSAYISATLVGLWLLDAWIRGWLSGGTRLTLALVLAGLALTPARPAAGEDSWAPAVIVLIFDFLNDGSAAAGRTLQPMLVVAALALGLGLLITLGRRARRRE